MTVPAKHLFVPREQAGRVVVEPHIITGCGVIAQYRACVVPVLDRMHRRQQLTARQHWAGQRLYQNWVIGEVGARNGDAATGPWQPGGYADKRLDALAAYRGALQHVGQRLSPLVCAVCLEDRSVESWAKEHAVDRHGATALLRHGLDVLGDYWEAE